MTQTTTQNQSEPSDGEILTDFAVHRRQESFAKIVQRHGGMVLSVCRSILGSSSDAEDAAQAVFLTLAQKTTSLKGHKTVVGWLHRVAWYVAARAAEAQAIRRGHEREAARMRPEITGSEAQVSNEQLHAALEELPEKYRIPLLLHHIEGRTLEETAALVGCKTSATTMRLTRGKLMLRERLIKRGMAVSLAVVTASIASHASAGVTAAFVSSTANIAVSLMAGGTATATASATVAALTKGATNMLWMSKMKVAAAIAVAVMLLCGLTAYLGAATASGPKPVGRSVVTIAPSATLNAPASQTTASTATAETTATASVSQTANTGKGIRFAAGPADGLDVVNGRLKRSNTMQLNQVPELADVNSLKVMPPLIMYDLFAATMSSDGDQRAAKPFGFQYLVKAGDTGVVAIVLRANFPGNGQVPDGTQFESESFKNIADAAVRALDQLAKLDQVRAGSFEARLLRVQGLANTGPVSVIWLKSDPGGTDLFYPQASPNPNLPNAGGLQQETLYTADDFLAAVGKLVAQRQANPSRGRG